MEKILLRRYGAPYVYDDVKNTFKEVETLPTKSIFIAKEDGQIISEKEVINYSKGDVIILMYYKDDLKSFVVSDNASKSDFAEFEKELIAEREAAKKKQSEAMNGCCCDATTACTPD